MQSAPNKRLSLRLWCSGCCTTSSQSAADSGSIQCLLGAARGDFILRTGFLEAPLNVANLVNVCKFDDFFANLVNFHELGQFLWFLAIFTFFWQIWWIWLNYAKMRLIFANLGNFSEFGKLDLGPKVYSRKDQILWIWQGWGHWISKVSRNRRNDKISWKWK